MKLVYSTVLVMATLGGLTHYYVQAWGGMTGPAQQPVVAGDHEPPAAFRSVARLP